MDKESQDRNKNSSPSSRCGSSNDQGGFVAVLHVLEEQLYGPDSPLPAIAKVLLYIRHRALRDWTKKKQIPKSEITQATGVEDRSLKQSLRNLEKKKMILVTRMKTGKIWSDNVYELHPDRFGNDYIYRPEKPSFRVIYGSKVHPSNPSETYPHSKKKTGGVGSNSTLGVGYSSTLGVGYSSTLGKSLNTSKSLRNSAPKNPLKEHREKTLSEEVAISAQNREREQLDNDEPNPEKARKLRELIKTGFRSI